MNFNNPLLHDVVIKKVLEYLAADEIKVCRRVCKQWNDSSWSVFQKSAVLKFRRFENNSRNSGVSCENFNDYLENFMAGTLAFYPKDSFLFRNFAFINYRTLRRYAYEGVLRSLIENVPESVQSLTFMDDLMSIHEPNNYPLPRGDSEERLLYPEWKSLLVGFPHLHEIGLHYLRSTEIEKFLKSLAKVLEMSNFSLRIRKLEICPGNFIDFDLTRALHQSYIDSLKSVTSLLGTIEDFTLHSNLSAEELPPVLSSLQNRLINLRLRRFPLLPAQIQIFQSTETSIFPDLFFPRLKLLEIPNVYFDNIDQLNRCVPSLESLQLKYQPMLVCTELEPNLPHEDNNNSSDEDDNGDVVNNIENMEDADLLHTECVSVRLDFFSFVDGAVSFPNKKVKSVEWTMDDCSRYLRNFNITIGEISDVTLHTISLVFTQITEFKGYITTPDDVSAICEKFVNLEELVFSGDSPHATTDEDMIGKKSCYSTDIEEITGIQCLKKLRRLVLNNNNSKLTEKSFTHGFFHLPNLRTLEIHQAPQFVNNQVLKDIVSSCPNLVLNLVG